MLMTERTEETMPVAVWVDSIGPAKQAYFYNGYICNQSADVRASSSDRQFTFELTTNPLSRELLEKVETLSLHGFTVVEVPAYWTDEYSRGHGWRDKVINSALDRVMQWQREASEQTVDVYDETLANEVLTLLVPEYPRTLNMIDVKYSLAIEPSDGRLLTALFALQIEKLIDGDPIPDPTSGKRKLRPMTNVRITREGKQHLSGTANTSQSVVHQYNNYGQAGAIGPHSIGTLNYQQQWATIASEVDLSQVMAELQTMRAELMKTAKTSEDFQKLALVADAEQYAEKNNGLKVMEILSKSGKWLFDFATDVGTDLTAKLIAKAIGLES